MTGSGLKALYYVVTTPAHQFWYMSSPQRKQRGATRTRKARDTTTKTKHIISGTTRCNAAI